MTENKTDWRKNPRVSRKALPDIVTVCERHKCPYNADGKCPSPRLNKQHDDAKCRTIGNRDLLASFTKP